MSMLNLDFELISNEPLSDTPHPRTQARAILRRRKLPKPSGPTVNQHATSEGAPSPKLEVDGILTGSLRKASPKEAKRTVWQWVKKAVWGQ